MTTLLLLLLAQELTDETYQDVRDAVVPAAAEMRWRQVPWRATLWDGVIDAQKAEKPILLWAMNGHPLACV